MSTPFPSPVQERWLSLVESAECNLFLVAPFISRPPLEQVADILKRRQQPPNVQILTCISEHSLANGSLDVSALHDFVTAYPSSAIQHRETLHAKAYIADNHSAIVTSANLTRGGLLNNLEYSLLIQDAESVTQIRNDLERYASKASTLTTEDLQNFASETSALRNVQREAQRSIDAAKSEQLRALMDKMNREVLSIQVRGESTNSLFEKHILYVLEQLGPLTTPELHPFVQMEAPSLCDDDEDRVIDGVHFGKKWKHHVRNAQQSLKRKGRITLDAYRRWHLT